MNNDINVKVDKDALTEILKRNASKKENSYENIFADYMKDVEEYLTSKLDNYNVSIIKEISAYCGTRMWVSVQDIMWNRDRDWEKVVCKLKAKPYRDKEV